MSTFPQIPGYDLQAELGRGGMAVVYSAIEANLGRKVAIKVVSAAPGPDREGHIERLENEARGLAALHHPHIVDLYTFGRTGDGSLYYVMPLLPGGSLEDWPRPAPEERVVALLDNLLDALGHAHAADIVHRDIKPANILFDQHGRPLLADFGAALMRRRDSRLTMHGNAIGSSGYMSPEQARGLSVDARSDLYSTAVLAFELLTGRRPFEGDDDLAIAIAQTEQPVPALPDGLRHWQAFFVRALAVRPEQRFADAAAMRAAIHALPGHAPAARGARPWVAWAIAAFVLLGAIGFAAGWFGRRAEPVHADAVAALMAAGHLLPPADPNVVLELESARGQALDRAALDALQEQLFERLGGDVESALAGHDAAAATTAWRRWREATATLDAARDAGVIRRQAAIEAQLRAQFAAAQAAFDRALAAPALAVADDWNDAPAELHALAAATRVIPAIGDRFRDADGPELVLVARPDGNRPALALTAAAVDSELFARFAAERALDADASTCAAAPAPAQGCFDLARANELARWLSERTRQTYRLPTRDELAPHIARIAVAPAYAVTSTCNEVRVARRRNVASRIRSGVRELFGRGSGAGATEVRCDGQFALKLDGADGEAAVREAAAPDTVLVLLREVPAPVPSTPGD